MALEPRILKFKQWEKSFFVSFNYITDGGIQDVDKLGTFDTDSHIYTSAFDNKTHQFHVNYDNDMCDDVYVLWCLLSEFIHTHNLSLEETGAEYNKIEMYIRKTKNIININLNLHSIRNPLPGEEIKNVITDEIIDGKISSTNATFGDFICNEIDLVNIDSLNDDNKKYGMLHNEKMFMKKDDGGGGGGGSAQSQANAEVASASAEETFSGPAFSGHGVRGTNNVGFFTPPKSNTITRRPDTSRPDTSGYRVLPHKINGGNPSSHIHTGQRGGRFVMVGGRKRYLRK